MNNKKDLIQRYSEGANGSVKYSTPRNMQHPEIDAKVWDYYCMAYSKNMPVNGPMLQAEAQRVAIASEKNEFTASNGWLHSFCSHHQLKMANLFGELAEVDKQACQNWKIDILPELIKGYEPKDIFNCDETGVFWHAVPTHSFIKEGEQPKGVKTLKERLSLLLTCSVVGEKLEPWIIGKSAKPWSFP